MASSLTSEEIFVAMKQAVEGGEDTTIQRKFKAYVVFHVEGQDWCLNAKKGTLQKGKGNDDDKVDLTVTTSLETLEALLNKKLTPQQAFIKGKLKIKGKMNFAMKLTIVLAATRKQLPSLSKL